MEVYEQKTNFILCCYKTNLIVKVDITILYILLHLIVCYKLIDYIWLEINFDAIGSSSGQVKNNF